MPSTPPSRLPALAFVACLALAGASGFVLATDREVSHLAVWRMTESGVRAAFDAAPAEPPAGARDGAATDLESALALARGIMERCGRPGMRTTVRWASEPDMLAQVDAGAVADCWPRSLLLVAAARRAGFAARLWALEGDRFDGNAHTVPELWLPAARRWVMFDVTMNAIARDAAGTPLGFLDVRERVLDGGPVAGFQPILDPGTHDARSLARYYAGHARYAFLRGGAGLLPGERYGAAAAFAPALDRLPEPAMKAVASLLGETGRVRYFRDARNASLLPAARGARAWIWAFGISLLGALITARAGLRRPVRRAALLLIALPPAGALLYAAAYFAYSYPPAGIFTFADGFESGDLRAYGRPGVRQTCCDHSAVVVDAPVREGRHALRMRLDSDDPTVRGNHRAEMRFPSTRMGSANDYALSVFVPEDWLEDSLATVVAQWHGVPDRWRGETFVPSPLHLAIEDGQWIILLAWDERRVTRSIVGGGLPHGIEVPLRLPVEKGRWADWDFHVRWAHDTSGVLIVKKDGVPVLRRRGPIGYNDAIGPYFKFGLYWMSSGSRQPRGSRTICFDDVRVRQGAP